MQKIVLVYIGVLLSMSGYTQQGEQFIRKDTTQLDEVILIGQRKLSNHRQEKTLSSIDDYLEKSNKITMLKRGNYAWEATLNNMTSERLNVTIDGMQIFGACTDKMDPVTSYVDVSNLEKVTVNSGQQGAENGHSIGGAIDMKRPSSKFYDKGLTTHIDMGYETNGNYGTTGLDLEYSGDKFYLNTDGIFRRSDNYKAGNQTEVFHSQFQKYNLSLQGGYKLSDRHILETNIIYDKATDIGYPALPMDVSLAEALISSITYRYKGHHSLLQSWESKIYFNTITHIMDDSQRDDVAIRMDMPGWSDTYGIYSKAALHKGKHKLLINLSSFYNRSIAEMTMYPNDPNQPDMFMYTWPDIRTFYSGVYVKEAYAINAFETVSGALRFGYHNNTIAKQTGLESLQIFYPNITDSKNRMLMSLSADYKLSEDSYDASFALGYGERAPSVSEGYGFFLFNSFDNYDYIGNPNLKKEKSLEFHVNSNFHFDKLKIGLESSCFYISDYIIGDIDTTINSMTIGADGVRVYKAIDYATILDVYLDADYTFNKRFSINSSVGYNYGTGNDNIKLPLIRPFSYLAEFNYNSLGFNAALQLEGNANQSQYSSFYGEDKTPAYGILNLNLGNMFYVKTNKVVLKYGVENILDANYSTYADWNNIARQGRNFYMNVSFVIR
ncbi:TonB-dependent receptor plug domain-containing protein [Snuella sedimenti]|uniref:TonB-dependent receptor plug domain-containing protein n=1 Tax=Snuella sedimenti TaxID=2798802 RepID=A0A8J7J142_9FLAO|nr:TonB-dependent receptor plug domain-containing protein [Snuella sedimenti]MBJ6366974.1 TonB-dependent receptor plug domain-containing protein [Snuella sedimenti]